MYMKFYLTKSSKTCKEKHIRGYFEKSHDFCNFGTTHFNGKKEKTNLMENDRNFTFYSVSQEPFDLFIFEPYDKTINHYSQQF